MPDDAKAVPPAMPPAGDDARPTAARPDATHPNATRPDAAIPDAALALHLCNQARAHHAASAAPVAAILRSAPRMARVTALARAMGGDVEGLSLPPWDVLPYDRTLPSAAVVGQRMRTLQALARPAAGPRLLLTSAAAALQRVRPARDLQPDPVLRAGDALDVHGLALDLAARGYHAEERVDEPGTVALRGHVVEVFAAGAPCPVRLEVADGRITTLHAFDPLTQRSTGEVDGLVLTPAIEFPLDPAEVEDAAEALVAATRNADMATTANANGTDGTDGKEDVGPLQPILTLPSRLVPLFDLLPGAPLWMDPEVPERWDAAHEQALDAFAATRPPAGPSRPAASCPAPPGSS